MMFVASAKDCFCSICYLGYHRIDPVWLVRPGAVGFLWMVVCVDPLRHLLQRGFCAKRPSSFLQQDPALLQLPGLSPTNYS